MRAVFIILAVIAVSFLGFVIYGLARDPSPSGGGSQACGSPPPMKNGDIDKDALEGWCPPSFASGIDSVLGWFAPRVTLSSSPISVDPGADKTLQAPSSAEEDPRAARFAWRSGAAMRISYSCVPVKEGDTCPQTVCVCKPGAILDAGKAEASCGASWVSRRRSGQQVKCGARDKEASLLINRLGGAVTFQAVGAASSVEQP